MAGLGLLSMAGLGLGPGPGWMAGPGPGWLAGPEPGPALGGRPGDDQASLLDSLLPRPSCPAGRRIHLPWAQRGAQKKIRDQIFSPLN